MRECGTARVSAWAERRTVLVATWRCGWRTEGGDLVAAARTEGRTDGVTGGRGGRAATRRALGTRHARPRIHRFVDGLRGCLDQLLDLFLLEIEIRVPLDALTRCPPVNAVTPGTPPRRAAPRLRAIRREKRGERWRRTRQSRTRLKAHRRGRRARAPRCRDLREERRRRPAGSNSSFARERASQMGHPRCAQTGSLHGSSPLEMGMARSHDLTSRAAYAFGGSSRARTSTAHRPARCPSAATRTASASPLPNAASPAATAPGGARSSTEPRTVVAAGAGSDCPASHSVPATPRRRTSSPRATAPSRSPASQRTGVVSRPAASAV